MVKKYGNRIKKLVNALGIDNVINRLSENEASELLDIRIATYTPIDLFDIDEVKSIILKMAVQS
jgi:hypothetical protein